MASGTEPNLPQQEPPEPTQNETPEAESKKASTEPEPANQAEDNRQISEMVREAKQRKGTPRSNQAQNKSFRDAARGLTKKQMRRATR